MLMDYHRKANMQAKEQASERAQACPPPQGGTSGFPASGRAVLDEQALQRLRELDPGGENRLLERAFKAFEVSIGRLMPQLLEAQEKGDFKSIALVAHTLKSSSASLGAAELSRLCSEIETRVRQGNHADLAPRIAAMCAETDHALGSLRAVLEKA